MSALPAMLSLPDIPSAAAQLRAGTRTPAELVNFCLERIERYEPQVSAWVQVDAAGARESARLLGDLLRQGIDLGPLHGIPIGIKDIIDVAGWPTRAGSPLRRDHRADSDAPVVGALRRAGAILLGKTVTTEFACFDPPPTRNPWHLSHTPGGSSSGSAAALALDMCLGALGSQTGGSIVRPAAYCGVCGLKPTHEAVSREGVVPISPFLDHVGPMARTVADVRILFEIMTGQRGGEPPPAGDDPPLLYPVREFFLGDCDQEMRSAWEGALETLALQDAPGLPLPASFAEVHAMHRVLMAAGAAEYHGAVFAEHRDLYGPHVSALIEEGLSLSATRLARAWRHQAEFRADMRTLFAGRRIGVTPATPTAAPDRSSTGDPRFNSPWSYCGLPTVTIPCGLTQTGMPCGLQLIGPWGGESLLLDAAAWCETRLNGRNRPVL